MLDAQKRVLGNEHLHTLISMNNLALTFNSIGRFERAEGLLAQVLAIRKRVLGDETFMHLSKHA